MAASSLCSVDDCGKPRLARGYCRFHYHRWEKGISFNIPKRTQASPILRRNFVDEAAAYQGNNCLFWPYGRNSEGRPYLMIETVTYSACRLVCERVNGIPETPDLEAAHTCGKGHLGCVNGRHLYWATRMENAHDMEKHGTQQKGEEINNSKLTEHDIHKIRELIHSGETNVNIAERFGVDHRTISSIKMGRTWKHVLDL
jgi:hypothetical protein